MYAAKCLYGERMQTHMHTFLYIAVEVLHIRVSIRMYTRLYVHALVERGIWPTQADPAVKLHNNNEYTSGDEAGYTLCYSKSRSSSPL